MARDRRVELSGPGELGQGKKSGHSSDIGKNSQVCLSLKEVFLLSEQLG